MTKEDIYKEFSSRAKQKQLSLDMSDCPYNDDEKAGYKEGWNNAFMWAIEIMSDICK